MRNIKATNIVGDNFVKLLDLSPEAAVLYCTFASYVLSPTGLFADQDPTDSCEHPIIFSMDDIMDVTQNSYSKAIDNLIELAEYDLIHWHCLKGNCAYLTLHEIPEVMDRIPLPERMHKQKTSDWVS